MPFDEIVKICEIIAEIEGVDYIKTGSGFSGPTTYDHVNLIQKVAGGVRTAEQVKMFLKLGVNLFGSSRAIEIIEEFKKGGEEWVNF